LTLLNSFIFVANLFSHRTWRIFNLLVFLGFTWGCSGVSVDRAFPQESKVYLPPTSFPRTPLVLIPSPTTVPTDVGPLRSSTPACSNGLRFLDDVTIPDGSQVAPGSTIDKQWKVENVGACNWDENYRLRLVGGSELGASTEQALYPARSGTQAIFRAILTAPSEPGVYRSAWQAYDPQGQPFGDTIFIQVIVVTP
jgi:hypothetical protein